MKIASLSQIKTELNDLPHKQLLDLCLALARFKKENKELLSYLLFDAHDEPAFAINIKTEIDENYDELSINNWYLCKKGLRKILKNLGKYSKFLKSKEIEIEILLHFVNKMQQKGFTNKKYKAIDNIYVSQVSKLKKLISYIHEDLQFDYLKQLQQLDTVEQPTFISNIWNKFRKK